LRFIHPTVKEALNQQDGPGRLIDIKNAHSTIAHKLLAMLMSRDVPDFSRQTGDPSRVIADYTRIPGRELYEYAVLNWYKHSNPVSTSRTNFSTHSSHFSPRIAASSGSSRRWS
jgi:hypothetical protein